MAMSQILCVSVIFLGACALAVRAEDLYKYPFIVRPPPQNISCFECNNYSFNNNTDKERSAVLNRFCAEDPARVTLFKKRCSSKSAKGCAMIKADYSQYSSTRRNKRIYRVRRFCTDDLLPACEKSESSRGDITLCTCESDFCNPASALLPSFGLLAAAVMAIRLL